jgi:hypothetical protein
MLKLIDVSSVCVWSGGGQQAHAGRAQRRAPACVAFELEPALLDVVDEAAYSAVAR